MLYYSSVPVYNSYVCLHYVCTFFCTGSSCHQDKFLVCVNILGNTVKLFLIFDKGDGEVGGKRQRAVCFVFMITDSYFILQIKPLLQQFCHFSFTFHKVLMTPSLFCAHTISNESTHSHTQKINYLANCVM